MSGTERERRVEGLRQHNHRLQKRLAEAEAEIDRLSGMFTDIHRVLAGLPPEPRVTLRITDMQQGQFRPMDDDD